VEGKELATHRSRATKRHRLQHPRELRSLFRTLRASRGLTQTDVAKRLSKLLGRKTTLWWVSRVERGIKRPNADELTALVELLGLPALRDAFPSDAVPRSETTTHPGSAEASAS
jgi:transcriptional regulator with XRE-family HTH domain